MPTPVRVAVMGLGQRGLQHLKQLWQLQQEGLVEITALIDAFPANLEPEKLTRFVPGLPAAQIPRTTDAHQALRSGSFDAFYICIPPNVHNGEVILAAEQGLHLFVEKPQSLYLDEAVAMQRAIQAAGVISTVGFQQRFDARYAAIHDFLADKPVVMASYTFHAPLEAHSVKHTETESVGGPSNRVWTANRAWSGGTVVEGGIHPLDLWRYWFGDVVWVQATYVHRPPHAVIDGADNPYGYSVQFGFANGAVGTMVLSRLRRVFATQAEHLVLWDEGHVVIEGDGVRVFHYDGPYPPADRPAREAIEQHLDIPVQVNTNYAISRAFIEAVAEQDQTLVRSSFDDAMNSLAAVLAANVSDELAGRRVLLADLIGADEYARFRKRAQ